MQAGARAISGHVFRLDEVRQSVWRAKYRLPDGRQVQKTMGPCGASTAAHPRGAS